jgi:hypothetical protein
LLHFEISLKPGLVSGAQTGRLFVVLGRPGEREPRFRLGRTGNDAPMAFAMDLEGFSTNSPTILNQSAYGFPVTNLARIPPGDYLIQALLEVNQDLRMRDAPGNLYSPPRRARIVPNSGSRIPLELSQKIPDEKPPAETEHVKYVRLRSQRLSQFHSRPIDLRAGIVLPAGFGREPDRKYPTWICVGGLNTRYTHVSELMRPGSSFRELWLSDTCPRFILMHLDGAGPFGDPYYLNSENNGPYADALFQELLPLVEQRFSAIGDGRSRVISGVSTGGWVSLALQIFYPDQFQGAWASCPDPVDFRALEVLNIYEEQNAYANPAGYERPSVRDPNGDVRVTLRDEIAVERLLGGSQRFVCSGEQWGAWHAAFSPRDKSGLPKPLWDPQTGLIDRTVAEHWRRYDLRHHLEQNWATLGPRLQGKLHIAAAESDEYFLANAVRLLDNFLREADPPGKARIAYGPGERHGWSDLTRRQMLEEMEAAVRH